MAPYDETKNRLNRWRGEKDIHRFAGGAVAGAVSACLSLPFDNAKTKM